MPIEKIVYLIGAGAVQGEMVHEGIESDITMAGISKNVYEMSKSTNGHYCRLIDEFGISREQDVELMMSLCEGFLDSTNQEFDLINEELRRLFQSYLVSQISQIKTPKLLTSFLHINKRYGKFMGDAGEKLLGVLTINYDSLLEEAFRKVYGSLNVGCTFISKEYNMDSSIPPLLKLHGSFNWRIRSGALKISQKFEKDADDYSGWIPPSVYKKPSGTETFQNVWKRARKLLIRCDTLRVIGSSLRNEDWSLLSLIFTSQVQSKSVFNIELIVPDRSARGDEETLGIIERLAFLGKVKPPSDLPIFTEYRDDANIFLSWLLNNVTNINRKNPAIGKDLLLADMLNWGE